MRRLLKISLRLLVMHLVILPTVLLAADNIQLSLMEYAPLMGEKLKGYGIEPAVVTAAFKKVNVDVKYDFFPPKRTFQAAKDGVYDGTVGWVRSEEREKSFYYSEAIFQAPLLLFHLKEFRFDWETIDDLRGVLIGITANHYYGPAFQNALDAGNLIVDVASKDTLQFDKLLRHRIKINPMNLYTGYYMIQEKFTPEKAAIFTHHPRPLKTSVYHVLFPRKVKESAARVDLFNEGLQQLKDSGEYDKIIETYKKQYKLK